MCVEMSHPFALICTDLETKQKRSCQFPEWDLVKQPTTIIACNFSRKKTSLQISAVSQPFFPAKLHFMNYGYSSFCVFAQCKRWAWWKYKISKLAPVKWILLSVSVFFNVIEGTLDSTDYAFPCKQLTLWGKQLCLCLYEFLTSL